MSTATDTELSHGFSAGNYANAYQTQDLDEVSEVLEANGSRYRAAFILGFFSSYELHEIPADARERFDEAYHSEAGQRVLELGYTEPRKYPEQQE